MGDGDDRKPLFTAVPVAASAFFAAVFEAAADAPARAEGGGAAAEAEAAGAEEEAEEGEDEARASFSSFVPGGGAAAVPGLSLAIIMIAGLPFL